MGGCGGRGYGRDKQLNLFILMSDFNGSFFNLSFFLYFSNRIYQVMTFTEQYPVKLVEQEVHVDLLQLYHAVPSIALYIYLEYVILAIINKNDT